MIPLISVCSLSEGKWLLNTISASIETVSKCLFVCVWWLSDGVVTKPLPNQTSVTEASGGAGEECSPADSSQR